MTIEAVPFSVEGPQPLVRPSPDPEPFPIAALGPLCTAAEAIARVTEAPPALCAASTLAAAALAVQGLRDVETLGGPRPISLFLLTVAESGERKSTADRLAMRGVRDFETSLRPDFEDAKKIYGREHAIWEKRRAAILKTAARELDSTRSDLIALGAEPEPPLLPTIVTGSATVEGIVKHLPQLRASLGIMSDEGGMLLGGHGMKAENRLNTLATLAAMWDGATLDRWRAGDGIASFPGRRFSTHLLIQPDAAEDFLADPLANGQGLLARFLTCRPRSHIGERLRLSQDERATEEVDRFAAMISGLLSRPLSLAEGRRNELAPPILTLMPDARRVLVDFAKDIERAQAPGGVFEDARAFASKVAEQAARVAAVITLVADPEAGSVRIDDMARGIEIAAFYANEAARLQGAAVIPAHVQDAERMRRWLLGSWSEPHISATTAAQRGPFKLTERSRKALVLLEGYGWLIPMPGAVVDGKRRKEAWTIVRRSE